MNLCRCERGHFYDKEKYATCPHCASGGGNDNGVTQAFDEQPTEPAKNLFPPSRAYGKPDTDLPISGVNADDETVPLERGIQPTTKNNVPTVAVSPLDDPFTNTNTLKLPDDDDDDRTIGIFDDDLWGVPKTTGAMDIHSNPHQSPNKVSTPCVGWLVALSGGHIGTDFRLKVGKNFIGRNPSNDIALTEDKSVSRDRHAIVVYEPKMHLYLVQPGEASTLVYMNNDVVLTPVKLQPYDMITVGDVNLLFMPLCGERFNWGDLLEQMRKKQ